MRKRIVIALLVIFVLLLGIIILPEVFSNEPKYQGKRVSSWFKQYYRTSESANSNNDEERYEEAAAAFRAMGTNAVPYLLSEFYSNTNTDSRLRRSIEMPLSCLPGRLGIPPFVSAKDIQYEAANAITEINPPTEFILPLVTNRLYGANVEDRNNTLALLCELRVGMDKTMPFLKDMLNGSNFNVQQFSLIYLERLGPEALPALPELVAIVRDPGSNSKLVHSAARALASIGSEAHAAIPYLQDRLANEPKGSSRINFAEALCSIDPGQTNALDVILSYARTPNDPNRGFAVVVLRFLGPKAKAAAPTLAQIAREGGAQDVWVSAAEGLANTGDTNQAISIVTEKFATGDASTRLAAAMFVLTYQPTNSVAITHLVKTIHDETWGGLAIDRLAKLRPIPESGLSVLRAVAMDRNSKFQQQAEKALKKVEAARSHE
jgi:hypothetical protein